MRLTLALVVSAIIAPLVASAPSSFKVENPVAIVEHPKKFQLNVPTSPRSELHRREAPRLYDLSLYLKEAHALSDLFSEFNKLFKNIYFDVKQFDNKRGHFNSKLAHFKNPVKTRFSGQCNLDAYIDLAERQFGYMSKASEVKSRLESEEEQGLVHLYNILELRANLGNYFIMDHDIRIENIAENLETKQEDHEELIQDVEEDTEVTKTVREAFGTYSAEVARLLNDLEEEEEYWATYDEDDEDDEVEDKDC